MEQDSSSCFKNTTITMEPLEAFGRNFYPVNEKRTMDVLLGQGAHTANHIGNQMYLEDAASCNSLYRGATTAEKRRLAKFVINQVYCRGGRFMERVPVHKRLKNGFIDESYWVEVFDEERLMNKARQGIRERPASIDMEILS